jgi:membrane protease YdiL (CAAX protease family)
MTPTTPSHPVSKIAIAFAMVFPSVVTWVYFQGLQDSEAGWQQAAFAIGKAIQFGFPIAYVWYFHRQRIGRIFRRFHFKSENLKSGIQKSENVKSEILESEIPETGNSNEQRPTTEQPQQNTVWPAIFFGLAVGVTMLTVYLTLLPEEIAQRLQEQIAIKISDLGIDSAWKYLLISLFYAVCHSFLEEYYWRWFVFDCLRDHLSTIAANILSSLGFMAHHIILLAFYFGWSSPMTWLCSAGVAIGGSAWAWMYARDGSLKNAWLSHAIVDAAIFGMGFYLLDGLK